MNSLKLARQLVQAHPVPKPLRRLDEEITYYDRGTRSARRVTPRILARSLHYVIKLRRTPVADESAVPLGASKYKGLPHLPPSVPWPDGHYFLAQVNLDELHPLDIHDAFPDAGMLYVFFSPEDSVRVLHYDGGIL